MKKYSLLIATGILLAGCQAQPTITPLENGYIVEATDTSDIKAAKANALKAAEAKCKEQGKEFYVMDETKESENEYGLTDTEASLANKASSVLLGYGTINTEKTSRMHFDCR